MTPSLEQFVTNRIRKDLNESGQESVESIPINSLHGTRPFLTKERYWGKPKRGSRKTPEVVKADNVYYVIDGHHKARRALTSGQDCIECRVWSTDDIRIITELQKMDAGRIQDLQIISQISPKIVPRSEL